LRALHHVELRRKNTEEKEDRKSLVNIF
jgi:hypothetical protein